METIAEGLLDFKSFEKDIFEIMCRTAQDVTREYLELTDMSIMALRDTKEYEIVGFRETTVKTVFGEVRYSRRYYHKRSGGYVFLLDDAMGIGCGCGLFSENLVEQIVIECTDKSYRKAASSISDLTGQTVSAMGAWGILQQYGERIEQQNIRLKELEEADSAGHLGNVSSSVIFDEFDDVWLSTQKEKRRNPGEAAGADKKPCEADGADAKPAEVDGAGRKPAEADGAGTKPAEAADADKKPSADAGADKKPTRKTGKKPMHVGTAYTGWTQSKDGRYSTDNKIAYASFGDVHAFASRFETLLRNCFDMDGVERRITNGDGEAWIRRTAEENDSILQLDPFHRGRAVIGAVSDKGDRKLMFDAITEKDVDKAIDIVQSLVEKEQDEKAQKKLGKLLGYLNNNKDIFLTWQERGIELPTPPEGVSYRNLGTQESSNCNLITHRMKDLKGSWSTKGANHMAQTLCFRHTIGLDAIMGAFPDPPPAKPWAGPLSAAKAPQRDGKGYGADWLHAEMPFEQAFRTNGREAIRGMLRMRPLSQLSFL